LWWNVIGGIESTLEAAGARQVAIRVVEGGHDGDDAMAIEGRWS
jgi:hypothetical protein